MKTVAWKDAALNAITVEEAIALDNEIALRSDRLPIGDSVVQIDSVYLAVTVTANRVVVLRAFRVAP